MERNNELREAIKEAYEYQRKADTALQRVNRLLKHEGFGSSKPNASIYAGDEFIVEYLGKEIFIEEARNILETRGYLIPDDFIMEDVGFITPDNFF
jgi:hypothetical protein